MLAATKVKISGGEKKSEPKHIQHFLHKTCSWKFHVVVGQNNGEKMYKKVCCTCKIVFWLIRPIVAVRVNGRMVKGMGMGTGNARYEMWAVWDPLPPSPFPTRLCDSSIDQFLYS